VYKKSIDTRFYIL